MSDNMDNYKSCIKLHGCRLPPPLINDSQRVDLLRYKEQAINIEKKLRGQKPDYTIPTSDANCSSELSIMRCVEGTDKLIEFLTDALKDVSDSRVKSMQAEFLNELNKCVSSNLKSEKSSSTGDSATTLSESWISGVESKEGLRSFEEGIGMEKRRGSLIRSNSFTLDSPTPGILPMLRSLAESEAGESCSGTLRFKSSSTSCPEDQPESELSYTPPSFSSTPLLKRMQCPSSTSVLAPASPTSEIDMQYKAAAIIQAGVRGYLTRRLLKTTKVKDLKKVIRESLLCAFKLHSETTVDNADVSFHVRLIKQVTAACYDLHSIFFKWPIKSKMNLIFQDRLMIQKVEAKRRDAVSEANDSTETSPLTSRKTSPVPQPFVLQNGSEVL